MSEPRLDALKPPDQSRSVTARLGRTWSVRFFVRRGLWVWPVLAAALLSGLWWAFDREMDRATRKHARDSLVSLVAADAAALELWARSAALTAAGYAAVPEVVADVAALVSASDDTAREASLAAFRSHLRQAAAAAGVQDVFLVGPDLTVVAGLRDNAAGLTQLGGNRERFLRKVLAGEARVSPPFKSQFLLPDARGELRQGVPTMLAAAPVRRGADGPVLAALCIRIDPRNEFLTLLRLGGESESGEVYAIDADGRFASPSRFDDQLKRLGLIPDEPEASALLTIRPRDPGADLTTGAQPVSRRAELPFTRPTEALLGGRQAGTAPEGYRDYRGVRVIGAWTWLDELDLGLIAEVDEAEALGAMSSFRLLGQGLLLLLALSAGGIFVLSVRAARSRVEAEEAREAGEYKLEALLGQGGMGAVYRARHARLRRPTAVKVLSSAQLTPEAVRRFEREVQATSLLTSPHTVAIYDYGRTRDGGFYYAMELLDGVDLQQLVTRFGPQPLPRVVHLLRQLCASLAEAHAAGLVHRDVKPANILLTRRGGEPDFVKVLDFGLVKHVAAGSTLITGANMIVGTPLYLAPEALNGPEHVDARADVHAVAAVGYFLLTGRPPFQGESVTAVLRAVATAEAKPPSEVLGAPVQAELEGLLLRCLAKAPLERPADAGQLLRALEGLELPRWTRDQAEAWWRAHAGEVSASDPTAVWAELAGPDGTTATAPEGSLPPQAPALEPTIKLDGPAGALEPTVKLDAPPPPTS